MRRPIVGFTFPATYWEKVHCDYLLKISRLIAQIYEKGITRLNYLKKKVHSNSISNWHEQYYTKDIWIWVIQKLINIQKFLVKKYMMSFDVMCNISWQKTWLTNKKLKCICYNKISIRCSFVSCFLSRKFATKTIGRFSFRWYLKLNLWAIFFFHVLEINSRNSAVNRIRQVPV